MLQLQHSNTLEIDVVKQWDDKIQVTSIDLLDSDEILFTGIEYMDDNFLSSIPFREK
ncbi:hypothetical protein MHB44_11365 [Lysinibacillus sp. FSL H8-0500]|uniref:hypothetical protein n=1 Tax=Lysinibacillus sp. FSL H8-0500 TaxID=2921393 RepID=UPI0031012CE8